MAKKIPDKYQNLSKILLKKNSRKSAKKPAKQKKQSGVSESQEYSITPKGVLYMALDRLIQSYMTEAPKTFDDTLKNLIDFQTYLLTNLSRLATNGREADLFGNDFNEFFRQVVVTINMLGRAKKLLDENGIELPMDDLDQNGDEYDDTRN